MRGAVEQSTPDRNDDGEKEKKKKRRYSRRSKHSASIATPVSCSSVNEISGEASECMENGRIDANLTAPSNSSSPTQQACQSIHPSEPGLTGRNKISFGSLPPLHISKNAELSELQYSINQDLYSLNTGGRIVKSCPEQIACGKMLQLSMSEHSPPADANATVNNTQRKYFTSHWAMDDVNERLQKGIIFKALFRVNAHNRLEAYCKIDGLPVDILINGIASQNRALEGDIVAIMVDPFTSWTMMKGTCEAHNNKHSMEDANLPAEETEKNSHNCKDKNKVNSDVKSDSYRSSSSSDKRCCSEEKVLDGTACDDLLSNYEYCDAYHPSAVGPSQAHYSSIQDDVSMAIGRICTLINLYPSKRPTGRVVAIIEKSRPRETIVGHLNVKKFLSFHEIYTKEMKTKSCLSSSHDSGYVQLMPNDARFPIMIVLARDLPDCIKKRLENGDVTVESELVAARIDEWVEESSAPRAQVLHVLGQGSKIESHIDAILFENAIRKCEFSQDSLSCLPRTPWKIPHEELQCRRDLRNLCIFTIDPSSVLDLDDALSVQKLANGIFRVGIHIADVSHFVLPDTALDKEAQIRSTSVYLLQHKIPMLPPLLSENMVSLNPGVDRLAFSLFLDLDHCGGVKDYWIDRTVICSCCKLSYEHAQDIIDGLIDSDSSKILGNCPQLHSQFSWLDVISSVKILHEISKTLKEKRFRDGALRLENSKIVYLYDEYGIPYDSTFYEQKDSNFLVEEFMLLANRTVAEVISRTYPNSALLRRQPEPILRKLREFESFCSKHGLELDTSSSVRFQQSLEQIRIKLHDDPSLFNIVISYATRPMQLATYFCNGELKDGENGSHYALAAPLYTHFTSPLRRYPDIVVHRTLAAALEAEELYLKHQGIIPKVNSDEQMRCFTGIYFDKDAADSSEGREALSSAASRHGLPCSKLLSDVALHCNNRKLASKHVADACNKLYMWALLKGKKVLFSDARVLGLGPRFMSVYIQKLAIERRIYYDEVEGLEVEWLDATSTLVLSFFGTRRPHRNRGSSIKWKALEDVALVISPCDLNVKQRTLGGMSLSESGGAGTGGASVEQEPNLKSHVSDTGIDPAVFPLTVRLLSTIPVALHAVGGDDGPIDIGVRLYTSSYLK